nr:RNA-dependent RNA polymerase [Tolivirales sp.]
MLKPVEAVVDEMLLRCALDPLAHRKFPRLVRPLSISGVDLDPMHKFRPNKKRYATTLINVRSQSQFEIDDATPATLLNGLLHRLFFEKRPLVGALPECANQVVLTTENKRWVAPSPVNSFFEHCFKAEYFFYDLPTLIPYTPHQFVSAYSGSKRKRYQKAMEKYSRMPELLPKHAAVQTFVKYEKCAVKTGRDPRIIQPRTPLYNLAVGRFLKPLEHVLYTYINKMFEHEVVFKGKNAIDQGDLIHRYWKSFDSPVAVGLDASRFDQHIHSSALKFEHSVYAAFYSQDVELCRLLSYQLRNTGYAKLPGQTIKYEVSGTRMSGDMNTAMGNVLLMCCMVYEYLNCRLKPGQYRFIDNGDDCVIILDKSNLHLLDGIPLSFEHWGFPLTIEEPVYMLEHLEFCQTKPVFDGSRYVMCRDALKCLTKDTIVTQPIRTEEHFDQHRKNVADCGLAIAGNLPIFKSFYECLGRGASPKRKLAWEEQSGLKWLSLGLKPMKSEPITDAARLSFFHAFGIMPHTQVAIEDVYKTFSPQWADPVLNFRPIHVATVST